MAYTKTTWAERVGTYLNRFTKSNETTTSVELVNNPVIETAGTAFSPTAMNNIENQVYALSEGNLSIAGVKTFTGIPAFNGGSSGSTAPFTVDSTTVVDNFNADTVDGVQGSAMWYSSSGTGGSDGNGGQPPAPKPQAVTPGGIGNWIYVPTPGRYVRGAGATGTWSVIAFNSSGVPIGATVAAGGQDLGEQNAMLLCWRVS